MTLEEQKYPIGPFQKPEVITGEALKKYITEIKTFPERLKEAVAFLSDAQLDTAYRKGGWTVRQVVNHCADSHLNGFTRIKLALTENQPTIKPYREERWAELPDTVQMPVSAAFNILEGLHKRWAMLLDSLTEEQLHRTFFHPENQKLTRIDEAIATYAWHGNHHLAHITSLKRLEGWK